MSFTEQIPKALKHVNQQQWNFVVFLDNHTDPMYQLPADNILELVIEESVLDWPVRGSLVYTNPSEGLERSESYTSEDMSIPWTIIIAFITSLTIILVVILFKARYIYRKDDSK